MMRAASFFILSVTLHAAALVYPVSFGGSAPADLIQVTILPMAQEAGGAGGRVGSGSSTVPNHEKSRRAKAPTIKPRVEPKSVARSEPEALPADNLATTSDRSIAPVLEMANSVASLAAAIPGAAGQETNGSGMDPGTLGGPGTSDNGFGSLGNGPGPGAGSGDGSASSETGTVLTQPSYRDTPRPDYPESARREGREGSVLLRVLVDVQGRSKKIEINRSSGSAALDRAAAAALRRWRFHPARYGDQPVESWLRIPIEFRLADAQPW